MAGDGLVDQQAVARVAGEITKEHAAVQRGQGSILVPLSAQERQALAELPGPEVAEPGAGAGRREHRRDAQLHRLGLTPGERAALGRIELRLGQVIDAYACAHQPTIE